MEDESLIHEPTSTLPQRGENVQLREPEALTIPSRLRRELERDQPRSRTRRAAAPERDVRRAQPRGWKTPAAVTAVLMAVLALWAFWPEAKFDAPARDRWVQLCRDYEDWYVPFTSRLDETDRIALRELGLISAQANIGIYNFDPRYIAGNRGASLSELAAHPPAVVRTAAGVAKTQAAASSIARLLEAFEQWPVHANLRAHLQVMEAHPWDRAIKRLREVLRDAPPRAQAPLTESLHRMIATEVRTAVIARTAAQLDDDLKVLQRVNDPVLQHFLDTVAALTDASLPPGPGDDQHLHELGAALQPLAAFSERFRATLESPDWQNVDYDGFRGEGRAYALMQDPAFESDVVFRAWLDEVHRYFVMPHDWRLAWARDARTRLSGALVQAEALAHTDRPDDVGKVREWAQALEDRIAALCEPVLTSRESDRLTLDRYAIEGEVADLASTVGDLAARASASDAVTALVDEHPLAAAPYRSDVVDARWRSELRVLGERLRRNNDPVAMNRDVQDLRARLHALIEPGGTRSLPPVPDFGADHDPGRSPESGVLRLALIDHCRQSREAGLAELLARSLPVDPGEWKRVRSAYLDTLDAAERLADLADDTDRMFREARLPDDPALRRGGQTLAARVERAGGPLLDQTTLASAAQPVLVRAQSVIAAYRGGADTAALTATAEPITALAAWAGGHEARAAAASGRGFDQAREEIAAADRLAALVQRIDNPARMTHWQSRLDRARRDAWRVLAEAAETPEQIALALDAAQRMALSPDAMPPRMRFNALVAELRAADGDSPPSARRDAALIRQARALALGAAPFRDDPDAGRWVVRLEALTAESPDATPWFESAGPTRAGWKLVAIGDDGAATFARGDDRMRFARLQTPRGPVYLGETELAVGTALDAAREAGAGRDLAALLGAAAGEDTRKGPRAWVYNAQHDAGLTPLTPNPGPWRMGHAAPAADAPPPTARTPLNYLSAEAAVYVAGLLGCRLPTDTEWRAAAEQWPAPALPANLRDRAWGELAEDVAQRIAARESGLAWADSDRLLTATSVDSSSLAHRPEDDGVAWLRPAPAAQAQLGPVDLRGNVAELVTRRPLNPAPLLDPAAGDIQARLKAFRSAHKNDFAVAGGSALSAPDEPLDQAQAYNVFTGSRGFADVGLRLAFPAPEFSPAQRLRVLLEDAPVLVGSRVAAR